MLRLKNLQAIEWFHKDNLNLAISEIIDEWKILPKYLCNGHIPLLQATQLVNSIDYI